MAAHRHISCAIACEYCAAAATGWVTVQWLKYHAQLQNEGCGKCPTKMMVGHSTLSQYTKAAGKLFLIESNRSDVKHLTRQAITRVTSFSHVAVLCVSLLYLGVQRQSAIVYD